MKSARSPSIHYFYCYLICSVIGLLGLFGLPWGNAWCRCLAVAGGGTYRCKNFCEHAQQMVVIGIWWAAPRCSFSSDTLPPLHLGRFSS
jgi:hypothetical protein